MPSDDPKSYWKSLSERDSELPNGADEFPAVPDGLAPTLSRRGFLRAAGFAFAGATLAGCSRVPEHQAVPYLTQPEGVVPGRSLYYASTCGGCSAGCGLLVKDRDGRPIKLEGNPAHPLSHGGLCAVGQASILGLYDRLRLRQPRHNGSDCTWEEVDREITRRLEEIRRQGGAVRFLSRTITSPTIAAAIASFLGRFTDGRQVIYDPLSCSAILDAHQRTHGRRVLPHYQLEKAEVIVSFDADFLSTWIAPVEFAAGYRAGRSVESETSGPSYHIQFESRLSLTGSKADQRQRIAPAEFRLILTHLAARLARQAGVSFDTGGLEDSPVSAALLDHLAMLLWQSRGRSLVLCGSQDVSEQSLCNFVNHLLLNYGATLDIERPSYQKQGDDRQVAGLLRELHEGRVSALFLYGSNPLYDLPGSEELASVLGRVPLVVSFAERLDETAEKAHFICPDHHYLESWADAEPVAGVLTLTQPAIRPFGDTRAVLESLAVWSGEPAKSAYEQIRARWTKQVFPRQNAVTSFEAFWDRAVHDGYVQIRTDSAPARPFDVRAVKPVLSASHQGADAPRSPDAFEVVLYSKVAMPEGSHAYNPWLQELPDPISKATWDNYACLSPAAAEHLGVSDGDMVRLEADAGGRAVVLDLPAFVQPGQHDGVIAVALGYGILETHETGTIADGYRGS